MIVINFILSGMPISSQSVFGPVMTLDPPPPQPNMNCPWQLLLVLVTSTLPIHCPLLPIAIGILCANYDSKFNRCYSYRCLLEMCNNRTMMLQTTRLTCIDIAIDLSLGKLKFN